MSRASLSAGEVERLQLRIAAAETLTDAEIRIVFARSSWFGIRRRAHEIFVKHGLDQTAARNAVMILIDTKSRELLIYGDEGVDTRVEPNFWDGVRDAMLEEFRAGRLADGVELGIRLVAEKLAALFPPTASDRNEIANELLFE